MVEIFCNNALSKNKKRAARKFAQHAFLYEWAAKDLLQRLEPIKKEFSNVLHIGGRGADALTVIPSEAEGSDIIRRIQDPSTSLGMTGSNKKSNLTIVDTNRCFNPHVIASPEFIPFSSGAFDLVLSTLDLHTVNDLPGTLLQIRNILKPDGLFLAALFGGETLHELRHALTTAELKLKHGVSPRVFPFADKQQMGALMQRAGFALPVIDSEIMTVTYENIFRLMHDLRGMGENNAIKTRSRTNPGKALFIEAARIYAARFAEQDGRIPASFEMIFVSGWAPHSSQPQALKPGSAKNRLADALNSEEVKA